MDLFWKIIFVIFFSYLLILGAVSFVMYWGMKLQEFEHERKISDRSALEKIFGSGRDS